MFTNNDSPGYLVRGGRVDGHGTITGWLSLTPEAGQSPDVRSVLHPGYANGAGTLTIIGNLSLGSNATLAIDIDRQGNYGRVIIQKAQDGTLGFLGLNDATFRIIRNRAFTPPLTAKFLIVEVAAGTTGRLAPDNPVIVNPEWNAGGNNLKFQMSYSNPRPDRPRFFQLTVIRQPQQAALDPNDSAPDLVAAFDQDPDFQNPVFVSAVYGDVNLVGQQVSTPEGGSFIALADGRYDYRPAASFVGEDPVEYTVSDGITSKVPTLTFYTPGIDPLAIPADFWVNRNGSLSVQSDEYSRGLLDYALNFDSANLAITEVNGFAAFVGMQISTEHGLLTVNANGALEYTPSPGFVGEECFTVTFFDGAATLTGTVTLHVTNSAPTVSNAEFVTLSNEPLYVPVGNGLLTHASDADGDLPFVVAVNDLPLVDGSITVVGSGGGTLTVHADGSFEYFPTENTEQEDVFTFILGDGLAECTANLTIHFGLILID